jgi:CheY-like chemotaxis protein
LLGLIDECLSEAEPHRRHVATLSNVANVLSEQGPVRLRPILRGPLRAEPPAIMPGVAIFVSITLAGDASALLQKLRQVRAHRFMPHMRGFESIRIFHERAPAVPLIAMSGYAFANLDSPAPDFLRMALELGAARCLRKPFTSMALLTVINECLAEASFSFAGVVGSS